MELAKALDYARAHTKSVFVTMRRDGKPQLSNVLHSVDSEGVIRVSITNTRAKYHNLVREPWAAIHASQDDFWGYAVLEGPTELSAVAAAPDDDTVEELVAYYRASAGEHDNWDEFRAVMVQEHRLVARIRPDHAYGMLG